LERDIPEELLKNGASPSERDAKVITIGVLSDTHGHLYPRVKQMMTGMDHIIHAGDVGSAQVLAELAALAPVTAVRGNCDLDAWARTLPLRAVVELGGVRILVGHIAGTLHEKADPAGQDEDGGFIAVITGHSHMAAMARRNGVVHLNPGSAGPRRYGRPRTVARLTIRPESTGPASLAEVDTRAKLSAEILIIADD
jgi:putative phosphoesterase